MKKVYMVTYYTGEAIDMPIRMFSDEKRAKEYVDKRNEKEPATKHSGGDYYHMEEWEVE